MTTLPPKRNLAQRLRKFFGQRESSNFENSRQYWEDRYSLGGHSGRGSYGALADYKAAFLNEFVEEHDIQSVLEFGCGDSNQLSLANYQNYLGVDVSPTAIEACRKKFDRDESKSFCLLKDFAAEKGDLALSLNVIHHLVEDSVFESHMRVLFDSSKKFVIVYSSNFERDEGLSDHVRHRQFTNWVEKYMPDWSSAEKFENPRALNRDQNTRTTADFYVFSRKTAETY